MTDPIAAFIRAERAELTARAPSPHAARAWHAHRARRAASVQRLMLVAGWACRLVVAALVLATMLVWKGEVYFPLFLLALVAWLTSAACAPLPRRESDPGSIAVSPSDD